MAPARTPHEEKSASRASVASPPTTARLRHDIDRGRGGDKVDVSDPATAPLGTDDEAAGTPPAREAIQQAHVQEIGSAPRSSERTPEIGVVLVFCAIVLALAAAIAAAAWL